MSVLLARTVLPGQPPDLLGEAAVGPDRVEGGQPVLPADLAVDLAEGRRQVHQSRALLGGDVVGRHHPPPVRVRRWRQIVKGALVAQPDQRRPAERRVTRAARPRRRRRRPGLRP